ncbi:hypothetical protein DV737_g376, partial [Chaetothyriales sp. CBS 132003]
MADSAATTPSLLPGQSPPLFTITPSDQAGTIVVVAGVCFITAVVSALIRVYILVQVSRTRINSDDWVIALALFFAIIQSALVLNEANTGLGRTINQISSHEARKIQQTEFADHIFYILAVWTSKISVALFFLRLSPLRSNRRIALQIIAVVAMSAIASLFIIGIVCDLSHPWQYFTPEGVTCTAPYQRWIGVAAIDIVTEVALAAIALKIIWSLQIRSSKKLGVAFAFLQRLVIIAPIIAHLHYLSVVYHSDDPTLRAAYSTICKQVEVALAIVTASVPCLKPFLSATATYYGAPAEGAKSSHGQYANTAGSSKLNSDRSFKLRKLNLSKKKESPQSSSNHDAVQEEHFDSQYRSQISATSNEIQPIARPSVDSNDSKGMIIRKDVHFTRLNAEALFDSVGPAYEDAFKGSGQQASVDWLLAQLPAQSSVLDIGCGTGRPLVAAVAAAGHTALGIDVSGAMIAAAKQNVPNATFERVDIKDFTPPSGQKYDAITVYFSLIASVTQEEIRNYIAKFYTWLKDGGIFIFATVPIAGDNLEITWMGRPIIASSLSVDEVLESVKAAKFEVLKTESSTFLPKAAEAGICDQEEVWEEPHLFVYAKK